MSSEKSDLILHQGRIAGHPQSDTIAIGAGRIMACGRYEELKPLVGPGTHLIRLEGRTVAPGLIDSHLHFLEAASVASGVVISRARTIAELLAELSRAAAHCAPGNWLKAFGCDEALLDERRGPTRAELDGAVPKNPLRLRHQTLHASWLNSRAIGVLGLEQPGFNPPAGAQLYRDTDNRLTGLVTGMEEWLTSRLPPLTAADLEARAKSFSRELAAAGVTAFTDATVRNSPRHLELFAQLQAWGAITQNIAALLGEDYIDNWDKVRRKGRAAGVQVLGIKFRGRSPGDAELNARVEAAVAAEAGCAFHATEIEEVEAALYALEAAQSRLGRDALARVTCRIEHGGVIAPDQMRRIAQLNAWVVTNPGFVHFRGEKYRSEPGLIPYTYRCRTLAEAGIRVAGGTDAPVTPAQPLIAIAAAVTRRDRQGHELAPGERIDLAQAYRLFCGAGAELAGYRTGSLLPGRAADLIVMARDPLEMAPDELVRAAVELTVIAGRVVYERGRPASFTGIPDTI